MRRFALTLALSTSAIWGRRDNTRQDSKGRDGLPQPQRGPPPSSTPRPQRAGPPAPAPTLGPQHPAQARRPSHAHPGQGPSALPELEAVPRYLWERRERPQSKRSKEKEKEGQGPRDSPGGGVDTKRAGKAPGVARGLQAHPRSRLPFPPLPRLPDPFQGSSFLLPSGPLRSGSGLGPGD